MDITQLMIELSGINAPAGFEAPAVNRASELLAPFVDEITTDPLGSLLAVKKCGIENAPRLMLNSHIDEIGMIVTGHEKGFLRFDTLGRFDRRLLPASVVEILTEPSIYGVVASMPVHVLSADEMEKTQNIDELFIDTGLGEDEVKERVPPGTPIVFKGEAARLGENLICGKALDDRSCCAIIIKAMELLADEKLDVDLCVLLSSQEELGTRGATTGAYNLRPDYAIVLDVTFGRSPGCKDQETFSLGEGAAIGIGPNMNRAFTRWILGLCREKKMKHQIEVLSRDSGTDCRPIQVSGGGVRTALISLPLRYMHSPNEVINTDDAESIIELLCEAVRRMGEMI